MQDMNQANRRRLLKMLGGAPMLPIGGVSMAALLAGCNSSDDDDDAAVTPPDTGTQPPATPVTFTSASFTSMPAPTLANPELMARTTVSSAMNLAFSDGSKRTVELGYEPFFITGDNVPDGKGGVAIAGGYFNLAGAPIMDNSVPAKARQFFSNCPDGTSLLALSAPTTVPGVAGNAVYAVVQFEYQSVDQAGNDMYGLLPSPIAVLTLSQDPNTGKLSLVKYSNVDTSSVHGLWITCGASLSPWGTHLSSEEYEPDATTAVGSASFQAYSNNVYGDPNKANPYHYGHMPEVTVHPDGTGTIKKHYCMGRISHELVQVMPDERTALMGDDATNGGLFMFVADRKADLSAGTLYVAKWTQTSGTGPGAGTLTWIKLGHATSAEVKELADQLTAADIMDVRTADPGDASFTKIRYSGKDNWVKLQPGRRQAAAFLETHRYAALVGGSLAFTKMEGTTVNIKDKIAYSAMSRIEASMTDGLVAGFKVETNSAGAVYQLHLQAGQVDTDGGVIDSEWVPVDMAAVTELIGKPLATPDTLGNTHNADFVSNPDNLKFSEKLRTLFVGEDSGGHVNNFMWAYNVDTKAFSRLLSCPVAAESTGLQAVDEINGWTYIMSNFQHPGDWGSVHAVVRPTLEPLIKANYKDGFGAAVGYLTGVKIGA
ncbi:PhoX family protein [Achromobacter spanius]|uniref:PhoX family protein n=1 Tax=Achromobacter spanius TaxID=217203 RepID=UPI0036E7CAED